MKEKAKTAPKELARRGLEDGTERLRLQLRDTAQHGQTDDYGGDRIEDTAVDGVRRAERGVENLLKKKVSRNRKPDSDSPIPDEPSTDPEAPETPPQREAGDCPRIKTREYPSTRDGGELAEPPSEPGRDHPQIKTREYRSPWEGSERAGPSSGPERNRPQIKTREAVTHSAPTDMGSTPQAKQPQIRTRESDTHIPLSGETSTAPADGPTSKPSPQAGQAHAQIKMRESGISDSNLPRG